MDNWRGTFTRWAEKVASNFDIIIDKTSDGFSLKLTGDFDATSAYELLYAIRKLADKPVRIHVNTSELKRIHSFGLEVFHRSMRFSGFSSSQIEFRGSEGFNISMRDNK
jgi:anti-anti-sigma regulatory factor